MTREDIYDHLAQVYLGKRKQADVKKKKQLNAWLVINIFITVTIFASAFYGLTAFLTKQNSSLSENVIYSLHRGPVRMAYNFNDPFTPVQSFSLSVAEMDPSKYSTILFSLRTKENDSLGVVKVVVKSEKNEVASYYVRDVDYKWKNYSIQLSEFKQITDWQHVSDVSFVLESWNLERKKGVFLIDNVSFSKNGATIN